MRILCSAKNLIPNHLLVSFILCHSQFTIAFVSPMWKLVGRDRGLRWNYNSVLLITFKPPNRAQSGSSVHWNIMFTKERVKYLAKSPLRNNGRHLGGGCDLCLVWRWCMLWEIWTLPRSCTSSLPPQSLSSWSTVPWLYLLSEFHCYNCFFF